MIFVEKNLKIIKLKTKKCRKVSNHWYYTGEYAGATLVYVRSITLNLSFMVILYVNIMMWDAVVKSPKLFLNMNTFLEIN